MRSRVGTAARLLTAAVLVCGMESRALAAPEAPVKPTENGAERRSGIVFGLSAGLFGLGGASGTPNSASKIHDSRYYSSSGLMLGNSFTLFIMGALADPLSVGFFFNGQGFSNGDYKAAGSGFGLRVDLYPFAAFKQFKPYLKDMAVTSEFGIGGTLLTPKNTDTVLAQGTQSFLSTGFLYDMKVARLLGGHLSLGPELDYQVITSTSAEQHGFSLAFRIALNGGP